MIGLTLFVQKVIVPMLFFIMIYTFLWFYFIQTGCMYFFVIHWGFALLHSRHLCVLYWHFFRSITSNTVSPLMMSLSFRPQCLSLYFNYTAATLHSLWSNSVISVLQILFLISCTLWQEACEILILFLYATP